MNLWKVETGVYVVAASPAEALDLALDAGAVQCPVGELEDAFDRVQLVPHDATIGELSVIEIIDGGRGVFTRGGG
jgi:hypothetical protein